MKFIKLFATFVLFCIIPCTNCFESNFCAHLENGYYESGPCMNVYIGCRNNIMKYYTCEPKNYVFDSRYRACSPPEQVSTCMPNNVVAHYDLCKNGNSVNKLQEIEPCNFQFGVCYGKTLVLYQCKDDKVFSVADNSCVAPEKNPDCTIDYKYNNDFDLVSYCKKHANGNWVVPFGKCTRDIVVCGHVPPYMAECNAGEIFDTISKMCLPKSQVTRCQMKYDQAFFDTSNTVKRDIFHDNEIQQYQFDDLKFCNGRRDGIYYNKNAVCINEINICRKGVMEKRNCQVGYGFDKSFEYCEQNSQCNFQDPVFRESDAKYLTELAQDVCREKSSGGVYSMGPCSPYFAFCMESGGAAFYCPAGTVFQDAVADCVPYDQERSCDSPDTQHISSSSNNLCHGISAGLIGFAGCTSNYIRCVDGQPNEQTCPEGNTVFDTVSGQCIDDENHPDCPNYRKKTKLLIPNNIPNKCTHHGEFKSHPVTCRKFLRCNHGKYVEFDCPPATVFVPSISVCDHEANYKCY